MKNSIKAALWVCLFLCSYPAMSQEWTFDKNTHIAYRLALDLHTGEVHKLIPHPETPQEHYVVSLAESLELLVTEDIEKYRRYEHHFEKRATRKLKKSDPHELFMEAETHLQWAFVYLKFGHEFDAALNFRHAYNITMDVRERFPDYKAILKTDGLLEVIIGSIPEKYNWVLGVMNMQGTIKIGLEEFEGIKTSDHALAFEAGLLHAFTQGFLLQNVEVALDELSQLQETDPTNRLAMFLGANLHLKNNSSEKALALLQKIEKQTTGLPMYYTEYLKGEIYLHKGEYTKGIASFRQFLEHYKGENYVKDSHYKMGLCYLLNGDKKVAEATFEIVKRAGKETTEPDRYAARSVSDAVFTNTDLIKVRYMTDGGYYREAQKVLEQIDRGKLVLDRDQTEYMYRKARLAHHLGEITTAKDEYQKTIFATGQEDWYFAPNACLQMGYISRDENDFVSARGWFQRALTFKKHEYKNSIDSKARSALAQLNNAR
jgi:tetratricopeptide (TPR) repeat protein